MESDPDRVIQPSLDFLSNESGNVSTTSISDSSESDTVSFDTASSGSEEDEMNLSTPYVNEGNRTVCRFNPRDDVKVDVKYISSNKHAVVDVVSFSDYTLFLWRSGHILKQHNSTQKRTLIRNNIKLDRLEVFAGYLHGVSLGVMHQIDNDNFRSEIWNWKPCAWSPMEIVHTSTTLDGNYLWVQSRNEGKLFNRRFGEVDHDHPTFPPDTRRNYGKNIHQYIEYNPIDCQVKIYDSGIIRYQDGACVAIYNTYGKVIGISASDYDKYRDIRLINWIPYFIGQ
jgi:hypothetical protein